MVVTGRWCLRVCLHVGRLLAPPAPCVRAPWRHRAAYLGMQVSCGGYGMARALHGREGHLDHERAPEKFPSPEHHGSRCLPRLLPWGLILLNWARVHRR